MYYLGIDIGKNNHEAGFIDQDGKHLGKSFRFSNTQEGFENFLAFIQERLAEEVNFCIGMEATGHYWLALYTYLQKQGFILHLINPIQSDSLRNFHIRQQKTDSIDCFLIADVMRFGQFTETHHVEALVLMTRE